MHFQIDFLYSHEFVRFSSTQISQNLQQQNVFLTSFDFLQNGL